MTQAVGLDPVVTEHLDKDHIEICESGLFDSQFYLSVYPDVARTNCDPLTHFLQYGAKENRCPHPLFDTAYYRKQAGNLIKDQNPLLHFLQHGNRLGLSPHQFFDTKFYLSKYPDIKTSTWNALAHFVQHGAYEYRWPNAHFDPIYYLKIAPHAYANNYLLHYLQIGQSQQIPTHSFTQNNLWHIPEILAQPWRTLVFFILCLSHSVRRNNIDITINYDHQFSVAKFLNLSLSRFRQGCGSKVKLTVPTYLTQPKRLEQPEFYGWRIFSAPMAFAYLYLANVLKVQSFFADARYLLHKLASHPRIGDLALCSLGDLLLVEAIWAREFRDYEEEGIVLNLFRQWEKFAGKTTWYEQTFEQALTVIKKALEANDKNVDAQWLLGYGLLTARKYFDVLEIFKRYPNRTSEARERKLIEIRAKYGIDRSAGITAQHKDLLPEDDWYIADLDLVNTADVPLSTIRDHICVLKPIKLPIESKIIRDLELIVCKNILEFDPSYLSQFKKAEILPEYGVLVVDKRLLIKESCHVKPVHASLFNSCLKEITDHTAFILTSTPVPFAEENCIYIGCNNNYYHWLIDELPRLSLVELSNLFENAPVLIDKKAMSWQCDLLSMLGVEKARLRKVAFNKPVSFKNLIVPSRLSRDMVAHPQAVSYMRKKLLGDLNGADIKKGKRIYAARTVHRSTGRLMLNERHIIDKFKQANFQIIDPAQFSIKEQIELFHDAEIIAGPVGAGLTNILFAPSQARILSLGASHPICETYTSLACAIGQESWSIRGASYARPYPDLIWTNFDYEINEKDIDFCFEQIL